MSLDVEKLAKAINKAISATDKDGQPIEVTAEMKTYAEAIINTHLSATTAHLLVTGTTTAASPLSAGTASNGTLVAFLPAPWLSTMQAGFPTADAGSLSKEAIGSTGYISGAAKINFASGNITGDCSSTAEAPGPLLNGAGNSGTIDGLQGSDWAKAVIPPAADPALSEKIYKAIVKYINENAEVEYASGSVTGICPPAAGSLISGLALNGAIS